MKTLFYIFVSLFTFATYGQVVINELDCDTPSTDDKEFIELKSTVPNFSLDGYVLVFFNVKIVLFLQSYCCLKNKTI